MSNAVEDVLLSLEWRLSRLEHVLKGSDAPDTVTTNASLQKQDSISSRLAKLERQLSNLGRDSPVIANLLQLNASLPESISNGSEQIAQDDLSTKDRTTIVLASASIFYAAQSALSNLEGLKLEDASVLIPFAAMQRRLARAQEVQQSQEKEMEELRERTAKLLTQWYRDAVLTGGEQLVDWEERLLEAEKVIRRCEIIRGREEAF